VEKVLHGDQERAEQKRGWNIRQKVGKKKKKPGREAEGTTYKNRGLSLSKRKTFKRKKDKYGGKHITPELSTWEAGKKRKKKKGMIL